MAASVESQIGEGSGSVSFSCLKGNTGHVLRYSRNSSPRRNSGRTKWNCPRLNCAARFRGAMTTPAVSRSGNSSDIIYGRNTPYGWRIEYADVDAIHRQDLVAFYHRYFFPPNIILEV